AALCACHRDCDRVALRGRELVLMQPPGAIVGPPQAVVVASANAMKPSAVCIGNGSWAAVGAEPAVEQDGVSARQIGARERELVRDRDNGAELVGVLRFGGLSVGGKWSHNRTPEVGAVSGGRVDVGKRKAERSDRQHFGGG